MKTHPFRTIGASLAFMGALLAAFSAIFLSGACNCCGDKLLHIDDKEFVDADPQQCGCASKVQELWQLGGYTVEEKHIDEGDCYVIVVKNGQRGFGRKRLVLVDLALWRDQLQVDKEIPIIGEREEKK